MTVFIYSGGCVKVLPLGLHEASSLIECGLMSSRPPAGFPNPADNYTDRALDLNTLLIQHPAATFYAKVSGESMTGVGIFDGDLLIIDRAATAIHNDVVLAALDGELCCKIYDKNAGRLLSANEDYAPIKLTDGSELLIEGVVICSMRLHRPVGSL
jgi:DNA polymerase V